MSDRNDVLAKLVDERIISETEAAYLRVNLPPDITREDLAGVILGEFSGVKPKDLASNMGISLASFRDNRMSAEDYRKRVEISNPTDYLEVQQAKREGTYQYDNIFQRTNDRQDRWAQEWESTGSDPEDVYKRLKDTLERLNDNGEFSQDEWADIEDQLDVWRINPNVGPYDYGVFVAEIENFMNVPDSEFTAIAQMLGVSRVTLADPNEPDYEQDFWDTHQPTEQTPLTPVEAARVEANKQARREVESAAIASAEGTFLEDLINDGIVVPNNLLDELQPRERLSYTGSGTVLDRTTGQVLSESEWDLIKRNEEVRNAYLSRFDLDSLTPALRELLESGKFTDTDEYVRTTKTPKTIGYYNPNTGHYETRVVMEETRPGLRLGGIPAEDLAIPTVAQTGKPWEAPSFDYKTGDGRAQWIGFTPRQREYRLKMMRDNGLISQEQYDIMGGDIGGGSPMNLVAMDIWETALSVSSEFQFDPLTSIEALGEVKAVQAANQTRRSGGYSAPKYSVPASLREIPDYKALAEESRSVFRPMVGRDLEDWELNLLADQLKGNYETMQKERIAIHKQAWDEAIAGGTVDVDFSEVTDPRSSLSYDIQETYANELDRYERVEDAANNRNVLMQSIITGDRMIG